MPSGKDWLIILAGVLFIVGTTFAHCQELPDAPSAVQAQQTPPPAPAHKAGMFTVRKSWKDPALFSNNATLRSPIFWGLNGACATSYIVDVRMTHDAREHYGSEIPAIAAVAAFNYISWRFFSPSFTFATTGYCVQHYSRDIFK